MQEQIDELVAKLREANQEAANHTARAQAARDYAAQLQSLLVAYQQTLAAIR